MEATVSIGQQTLSNAQVQTLRVAISKWAIELDGHKKLGVLDGAYLAKLKEIEILLIQNRNTSS